MLFRAGLGLEGLILSDGLGQHLSQEAFNQHFGENMSWARVSNHHADEAATERAKWLSKQAVYDTWGQINQWTDNRLFALQKHLIPRVRSILESTSLARPRTNARNRPRNTQFCNIFGLRIRIIVGVMVVAISRPGVTAAGSD